MGNTPIFSEKRRPWKASISLRFRLLGFVSDEDKVELLCAADAVVLPTEELEGFGILILESLAANKPIIGTPVGAIPETLVKVDERLLTRGTDPDSLAEKLRWAIEERAQLRARGGYRQLAETQYAWPAIVRDIKDHIGQPVRGSQS